MKGTALSALSVFFTQNLLFLGFQRDTERINAISIKHYLLNGFLSFKN